MPATGAARCSPAGGAVGSSATGSRLGLAGSRTAGILDRGPHLVLEARRHAADLAHDVADLVRCVRQLVRTEDDQDNEEDDDQLATADVEHARKANPGWSSNPTGAAPSSVARVASVSVRRATSWARELLEPAALLAQARARFRGLPGRVQGEDGTNSEDEQRQDPEDAHGAASLGATGARPGLSARCRVRRRVRRRTRSRRAARWRAEPRPGGRPRP